MPTLDHAIERIEAVVDEGLTAIGAQLWVARGDEVIADVAVGRAVGGPMTTELAHNTYCLSKPLVALALLCLVDDGAIELDTSVQSVVLPGWPSAFGHLTLRDLLDHQAGLDAPSAFEYRLTRPRDRPTLLARGLTTPADRPAYSELLAWCVVESVIESLTGDPADAFIRARVLDPLGLSDVAINGTDGRRLLATSRVSVPFSGLPIRALPLLSELLECQIDDVRPAFGVIWSMRDAGAFAHAVTRQHSGLAARPHLPCRDVLVDALTPRHVPFADEFIGRRMLFAGGWMVDPRINRLSQRAPVTAFGHSAGITATEVLCDPDHDLTIAVYLNGADLDTSISQFDRVAVVDAVYEDLGILA